MDGKIWRKMLFILIIFGVLLYLLDLLLGLVVECVNIISNK